jgi:hypothetical protein
MRRCIGDDPTVWVAAERSLASGPEAGSARREA